jgi:hypothetical protein
MHWIEPKYIVWNSNSIELITLNTLEFSLNIRQIGCNLQIDAKGIKNLHMIMVLESKNFEKTQIPKCMFPFLFFDN